MTLLFDTHIHLDQLDSVVPIEDELAAAGRVGVCGWVIPGVHAADWGNADSLASRFPKVWTAPGLHPLAADEWNSDVRQQLEAHLLQPWAVAVGEIGLDSMLPVPMERQLPVFYGQLELAVDRRKPVVIHCRKAYSQLLAALRSYRSRLAGGILHAFGGSPEIAREAIDLGFCIGFGGTLTYPQARRAPEVLRAIPAGAIVLETDAPDLAPHPFRGEPNRPCNLRLVAEKVGEIRGWSPEETARITARNARRVLNLPVEGDNRLLAGPGV